MGEEEGESRVFAIVGGAIGMTTVTVTSWSPALPPLRRGMPYPGRRNVRPLEVAGGTLMDTRPRSVGTSSEAPSAASGAVSGTATWMSSPRRSKIWCGATVTDRYRSPRAPAALPPSPPTRTRWPLRTPAGIRTSTWRRDRCQPLPSHAGHDLPLTCPAP